MACPIWGKNIRCFDYLCCWDQLEHCESNKLTKNALLSTAIVVIKDANGTPVDFPVPLDPNLGHAFTKNTAKASMMKV